MKKSKIMNKFDKIKKIIITAVCIITVFFSMPIKSNADAGILEAIASFLLIIPDGVQYLLNTYVSDETENVANSIRITIKSSDATLFTNSSGTLYNFEVTPYDIFTAGTPTLYGENKEDFDNYFDSYSNFKDAQKDAQNGNGSVADAVQAGRDYIDATDNYNESTKEISDKMESGNIISKNAVKMPLLDANFFKEDTHDSTNSTDILRPIVAAVYKNLRNLVLIVMLLILLYIGIRIIISSAVAEQVKYKQYLTNWVVGICLVFLMQYIMSAIMNGTALINKSMINNLEGEIYTIGFGTKETEFSGNVRKFANTANKFADNANGFSILPQQAVINEFLYLGGKATSFVFNKIADFASKDGWTQLANSDKEKERNFVGRKLEICDSDTVFQFDEKNHTVSDYSSDISGTSTKINAAIYDEKVKGFRAIYFCNIAEYCRTITTYSSKFTHIYSNNKESVISNSDDEEDNDYSAAAFWGYAFLYILITIETVVFLYKYLKRVIWLAFLTMIAPLIAVMYPVDKLGDGKAQTFNMWFKEYLFNALIQPLHILLYTVFCAVAMDLMTSNVIYGIVSYAFMIPAEKFFKKMFGFDKVNTTGGLGSPAAGMLAMRGLDRLGGWGPHGKGGPKGGSKDGRTSSKIPLAKAKLGKTGAPGSDGSLKPNSGGLLKQNSIGKNKLEKNKNNIKQPNSDGKFKKSAKNTGAILSGMGRSITGNVARKITGGKTGNLGQAFKGNKLAMLATGGKFLSRQVGRVAGAAGGAMLGAGVGMVSGALASALTGEDKFADALQKGVLVGGAAGFNRGGQVSDGIFEGAKRLYDEGLRNSAIDSNDMASVARAGKIRAKDWANEHRSELDTLSSDEYNKKINFAEQAFMYTDNIENMDQLNRMYENSVDSNGNIDSDKLAESIKTEKAKKQFGDLDIDKNYNNLLRNNKEEIMQRDEVRQMQLSKDEENETRRKLQSQKIKERDEKIKEKEKELDQLKDKKLEKMANAETIKDRKKRAEVEKRYDEKIERTNNQLKYLKRSHGSIGDDEWKKAKNEALERKKEDYATEQARKKTDEQRSYFN